MEKGQFFEVIIMDKKQVALIVVICCLVSVVSGCAVVLVGAGAGTVAYLKGNIEAILEEDLGQVYAASLRALDKLEISATRKEKDALSAVIVGRTAADKKITIKLKATENNLTNLSIRVGVFGNRPQSQRIYDEIKKHL